MFGIGYRVPHLLHLFWIDLGRFVILKWRIVWKLDIRRLAPIRTEEAEDGIKLTFAILRQLLADLAPVHLVALELRFVGHHRSRR